MQDSVQQIIGLSDACVFFRMKIDATPNGRSAVSQRQALSAFERYLGGRTVGFEGFTENLLRGWMGWLFYEDYTKKTSLYYLKNLSSLYGRAVSEGLAKDNGIFSSVRERVGELPDFMFSNEVDHCVVKKLQSLVRKVMNPAVKSSLGEDIVAFAVLCGGLDFDSIAHFRKDGYKGDDPAIIEIAERYAKPKNSYLFPFRQSERTPRQLRAALGALFADALTGVGLRKFNPPEDTARWLWSNVALSCSVSHETVAGCLSGRPLLSPVFAMVSPGEVSEQERADIISLVGHTLSDDPAQWHAMHLRPGMDIEKLRERFRVYREELREPEIYYPCGEFARRIGHKLVYENRPVVSGLIFFRSRMSEIATMFRRIGDLAWCYRNGESYAVIPQSQMEVYQAAIGIFTPETRLYPAGTVDLREGDTVKIIGGPFLGREGIFNTVVEQRKGNASSPRTLFRLLLPDNNGIEWIVDTDRRLVRKVSNESA